MPRSETETRIQLIDPKLRLAGWKIIHDKHVIDPGKACIETPISGMTPSSENPSGQGFADYVLFGDDAKPLAVIEAKKSIFNEEQGRVQACLYADAIEKKYGIRPIIYYTNGYAIKIIDGIFPPRQVFGFHRKQELEYLIQRRGYTLADKEPRPDICDRYYQKDAIAEVIKNIENKRARSLIVLATGTGKTRVSCAISDILIRNNYAKRILFLADRVNLVRQAKEETFDKLLTTVSTAIIAEGEREKEDSSARIVFSTYQSMLSIIKDATKCPYGIGHFDFIIIDEAHRSLFNKYAEIFDYFDAMMIGLTATPRNDIHKSTYRVFNLDDEAPNYEYDVIKGVKDGFLTYYRALDRTPDILKNGLKYDELDPEEKEQYEDLFTDDEGDIPPQVEGEKFYSIITNIDTIREVLKTLMNEGIRVNNGDTLGKTIIFARDHNHALLIQEAFRELFPQYTLNKPNGVDYCVVIDNKIRFNDVLQREFKEKQDIRIVVSVDMMDTGVDIPEVVNLVFFKRVLSKIKFWQMIGRGTRLCRRINEISPSKAYFERQTNESSRQFYEDKQGFLIFDVCNVFPFFHMNPEGKADSSEAEFSLTQKVFFQKVKLFKALQAHYTELSEPDKVFYAELKQGILNAIRSLNPNMIGVATNLKFVEKYSLETSWDNFGQVELVEVKKHIAKLIEGDGDAASYKIFDHLCYKFAETKYVNAAEYKKAARSIYNIGKYLVGNKMHIDEVKAHEKTLLDLTTADFINGVSPSGIEAVRQEIRELMRFIERDIIDPIISDFDDHISSTGDADYDNPFSGSISIEDFKTLPEKVQGYISLHPDDAFVTEIRELCKPSPEALDAFRGEIAKLAKSADEYNATFPEENDLSSFVRRTVGISEAGINRFLAKELNDGFDEAQLRFTRELLLFVSQNGSFSREDLLREDLDFRGAFNNLQISKLIDDLEAILS